MHVSLDSSLDSGAGGQLAQPSITNFISSAASKSSSAFPWANTQPS
jgi:hypothetical protein